MDIFSIILRCECFCFFSQNQCIVSVLKLPLNYFLADSSTMVHLLTSTLFKSYLACFCHYSCVCQKFLKPTHLCTLFSPVLITLSQLSGLDFPCFFYYTPQYFVFWNVFHNGDRKLPSATLHQIKCDSYST